jgi:hypothetical protein
MTNAIVSFYGQELVTAKDDDGKEFVAMKPLCENLGLDWTAQRQRLIRDEVLSTCMVMITTQRSGPHILDNKPIRLRVSA